MRISDWSSDVCSSDLRSRRQAEPRRGPQHLRWTAFPPQGLARATAVLLHQREGRAPVPRLGARDQPRGCRCPAGAVPGSHRQQHARSEEHTSELQSLMRISYAVFCLKKKRPTKHYMEKHATKNNDSQSTLINYKN